MPQVKAIFPDCFDNTKINQQFNRSIIKLSIECNVQLLFTICIKFYLIVIGPLCPMGLMLPVYYTFRWTRCFSRINYQLFLKLEMDRFQLINVIPLFLFACVFNYFLWNSSNHKLLFTRVAESRDQDKWRSYRSECILFSQLNIFSLVPFYR